MPPAAFAADPYEVDNVVIDADGKDTTEARAKALADGEKEAFAQVILRVSPAGAGQILAQVTHPQVDNSVRSYSVVDEKMSATHYHAILNYIFSPERIQAIAPTAATSPAPPANAAAPATPATAPAPIAPFAVTSGQASKGVLVVPVYNMGNNTAELWQDDNRWRNVWYDAALESGGGLVVVPLGDMRDRVDVNDTNVNAASPESLKHMYERYGVGKIAVLSAYFNEKADPKPTLEVTMKKLGSGTPDITQLNYTIHSTETLDALLMRASNDIARRLYKDQTIDPNKVEYDRQKEINARVNTTSITEWQALRTRLLQRGNIVDVRFLSISYYETSMVIVYKGTADMLGKTLVASGLRVMQDGNGFVLSLK